jgi:D-alanine-D-alanine ligase
MAIHTNNRLPVQLVLVTEGRPREDARPSRHSRDLDMTTPRQAERIVELLKKIAEEVILFTDLTDFANCASSLGDSVVWPHWNGSRNRNRTAKAAMICEIHGLRYVGPDPYARLIANDKSLSKVFIKQAGLDTPPSVFIAAPQQIDLVDFLSPPLIVKPNMEGSSIGIDKLSASSTQSEAKIIALEKLKEFKEGVIVEEYVSGPEVFVALAFKADSSYRCGTSERIVQDDPFFLHNGVYDYSLKFTNDKKVSLRPAHFLTDDLLAKILFLTDALKTVDLIRIDGRLTGGKMSIIEITPDPLMTPSSEFLGSLELCGHERYEVLRDIIERVAIKNPSRQSNSLKTSA